AQPAAQAMCPRHSVSDSGFSVVETLIGLFVLNFGLLAAGQLMVVGTTGASLSRSKTSAAIVAQDKIESLADLYRQNPAAPDLAIGAHGPHIVTVNNTATGSILNRFSLSWNIDEVVTNGKTLNARQVTVTVTPVRSAGNTAHNQTSLNKTVSF